MKVTGPGTGPGASGGPDASSDAAAPAGPGDVQPGRRGAAAADAPGIEQRGGSFADKLATTTGPGESSFAARAPHPARLEATSGVRDVGAIATDLHAGRISAAAAVDKLVQQVLDRQLGAGAPAAIRSKVEAALRDALESDPLLGDKLKALGA